MRRHALVMIAGLLMASCQADPQPRPRDDGGSGPAPSPIPAASPSPASTPIVSRDGQNYTMATAGALKIEGDENRYDIILPTDVLFDFDKAELRPEAGALLAKVKAHLDEHGSDQIHVRGYTDAKGSDRYNLTLSINRATAVCRWLKANGHTFTNCIGRGEGDPVAPNAKPDGSDDPAGRQRNRRVTISVVKYPDTKAMIENARRQAREARAPATE